MIGNTALHRFAFARPHSIRARLTITFTLLIALLLCGADFILIAYTRRVESRHANRALQAAADQVTVELADEADEAQEVAAEHSANEPAFDLPGAVMRDVRKTLDDEEVAILIVDGTGRVWRAGGTVGGPIWPRLGRDDGWRVRRVPFPPQPHNPTAASYAAFVAYPEWREDAEMRSRILLLSALSLFAIGATAAGAWMLVGGTLRPIDQLARQAADSAAPHGPSRARERLCLSPPSQDVEVVRLVETLNHLLHNVQENSDARGRFYAAASHELRTPLHVLSGQVELTLGRPRSREEYREAFAEIGAQSQRLIGLVESLLLLDQLDRVRIQPTRSFSANAVPATREVAEVADIVAACRRSLQAHKETVSRRELRVTTNLYPPDMGYDAPYVGGELAHIEILLRNLVDNAVRYTPAGGRIYLNLCSGSDGGAFEIENDAPEELHADVVARLGEAFFRPDASRASATGGNGLGLALCRALADANGWSFRIDIADSVLRARVQFPVSLAEAGA